MGRIKDLPSTSPVASDNFVVDGDGGTKRVPLSALEDKLIADGVLNDAKIAQTNQNSTETVPSSAVVYSVNQKLSAIGALYESNTLLTSNITKQTHTNVVGVTVPAGTYLCVFAFRADNAPSATVYPTISVGSGRSFLYRFTSSTGGTNLAYLFKVTAQTTVYGRIYSETAFTFGTNGVLLQCAKIA